MSDTRIRRRLTKLGIPARLELDSGASDRRTHIACERVVDKLIDDRQVDVLKALLDGSVRLAELVELDRRGELRGANALVSVALSRPLFKSWADSLTTMGVVKKTKQRYQTSADSLKRRLFPTTDPPLRVLAEIDWEALRTQWLSECSGSDWNHMIRGLSHALTVILGDLYHPFRREVVKKLRPAKERKRVPDLPIEAFWRVVGHIRTDLRPAYVTIAALGLRAGEYCSLTDSSLKSETLQLTVNGKTGERTVKVPEELWPWVESACPALLQYRWLRTHWARACEQEGVSATLHDLRHCAGQWGTQAGADLTQIKSLLGHSTIAMAARYAESQDKAQAATAIAGAMLRAVK